MAQKFNFISRSGNLRLSQKGVVLIFFAFILGLAAAAYLLKAFNITNLQANQDKRASLILANAKEAIIGYSLSRTGAGERPGDMPRPDYFASTETPANYDGETDGGCLDATSANGLPLISSGSNMRCLGRLPWKTIGMSNLIPTQNDTLGNMPWYAVSANLVDPTCMKTINPNVLNMVYTSYQCNSTTNLPHPWLTVKDALGNIISNRVAVVIILPMSSIGAQSRPGSPLAGITSYLEAGNSDFDNVFTLSATNSLFNDRLVFITIDELIAAIGRRASSDASMLVKKYQLKNTHFPYAAPLGSMLNNHISSGSNTKGMVPIDVTDTCGCTSSTSCSCSFSPITSVAFTRVSGTAWTSSTGCSRSGATCTCTGAGSCTRGTRTFSCTASGLCTHNVTGTTNTYTYSVPQYADVYSSNAGCAVSSNQAVCMSAGQFTVGLKEPTWFKANLWEDYLYYEWSATPNIQLGARSGLSAILINAGNTNVSEIGRVQNRPSSDIRDYLDSTENTNNDTIFDTSNKQKTINYNDQPFVISP